MDVYGSQRTPLDVGPHFYLILDRISLLIAVFSLRDSRASFRCLYFQFRHMNAGITDTHYHVWLYVSAGNLNAGPLSIFLTLKTMELEYVS